MQLHGVVGVKGNTMYECGVVQRHLRRHAVRMHTLSHTAGCVRGACTCTCEIPACEIEIAFTETQGFVSNLGSIEGNGGWTNTALSTKAVKVDDSDLTLRLCESRRCVP